MGKKQPAKTHAEEFVAAFGGGEAVEAAMLARDALLSDLGPLDEKRREAHRDAKGRVPSDVESEIVNTRAAVSRVVFEGLLADLTVEATRAVRQGKKKVD